MDERNRAVRQLESFLRGETAAVVSYQQALERVLDPRVRNELQNLLRSHQERGELLRARIAELGGTPPSGGAAWDAFAKLVAGFGKVFGVGTALAALQEGEEQALKRYRGDLSELDPDSQELIRSRVLPEQERTGGAILYLQQTVPA